MNEKHDKDGNRPLERIVSLRPVAWLHDVVQNDGEGEENDQALSFAPDNFPLEGDAPYLWRSIGHRPLYLLPSIEEMVNRFLCWPLPDTVCPDRAFPAGAWRHKYGRPLVGTNLLSADEARAMLEYVLAEANA